jgi:transposase
VSAGPVIMAAMTSQRSSGRLVSDQLWALLEPLIPPPPPVKNGRTGRPRVDDRAALEGILFVVEHGIAWKKLPTELGFGSGITCWRRLRAWQEAGAWEHLHHAVLEQLGQDGQLDWSRACLDSVSVRAKKGAS